MRSMSTVVPQFLVVFVTAPDSEVARRLARALVESRAAACVQLVPGMTSVYRWQGAIEESSEVLLLVKTTADRRADVEALVSREHPYDTPEIVAVAAEHVAPRYAGWLTAETR